MEKYDVFISYRRKGGWDTAKHLYDVLSRDGYRVSFDIETLRNGNFDTQLFDRIEQCKDFIIILDAHVFDRTLDPDQPREKDWVRLELAHALKLKKNIVSVILSGFTEFDDRLPSDITEIRRKEGVACDINHSSEIIGRLESLLTSTPRKKIIRNATLAMVALCLIMTSYFTIKQLSQPKYDQINPYEHGISIVMKDGKFGCINEKKDIILPCKYYSIKRLNPYFIIAKDQYYPKLFTNEGNDVLCEYNEGYGWKIKKLNPCISKGKRGYVNNKGELVIPAEYTEANYFNCGLAPVRKDSKLGYIDAHNNTIIPFIYDEGRPFEDNGLAVVCLNYNYGVIDTAGKTILPIEFSEIYFNDETSLIEARKDNTTYYYNEKGEEQNTSGTIR